MKLRSRLTYIFLISALFTVSVSCKKTDISSKSKHIANDEQIQDAGLKMNEHRYLDIYFLIGQSNMAGRAEVIPQVSDTLHKIYLFTGSTWVKAANPLNKYSSVRKPMNMQKLGPGYTFAQKLAGKTGHTIGLVVNARGGTSVEQWQKGYSRKKDFDLYERALKRIQKAKADGVIKGIIWHQGEANHARYSDYIKNLKKLIYDYRVDIGNPDLYFVAGQLGKWRSDFVNMNKLIKKMPKQIKDADYVSSNGLTPLRGDSTSPHFDSRSQQILGKRYAQEVLNNVYQ